MYMGSLTVGVAFLHQQTRVHPGQHSALGYRHTAQKLKHRRRHGTYRVSGKTDTKVFFNKIGNKHSMSKIQISL